MLCGFLNLLLWPSVWSIEKLNILVILWFLCLHVHVETEETSSVKVFSSVLSGAGVQGFTSFRFSVEPVDTMAVRGLPVVLNCSAVSGAPVRVEWKKDGTFLNLAADDRRRQLPDGSLFISAVIHSKHNKPDEGVYQCVATIDNLGTISSRTARLTVAGMDITNEMNIVKSFTLKTVHVCLCVYMCVCWRK